jgi:hypothetical protein
MAKPPIARITCPLCQSDRINVSALNASVTLCSCDSCAAQFTIFEKPARQDEPNGPFSEPASVEPVPAGFRSRSIYS